MEEQPQRLLRELREYQAGLIAMIARGGCSPENIPGKGYCAMTGQVVAMDKAIEMVLEVFKDWFPPTRS